MLVDFFEDDVQDKMTLILVVEKPEVRSITAAISTRNIAIYIYIYIHTFMHIFISPCTCMRSVCI